MTGIIEKKNTITREIIEIEVMKLLPNVCRPRRFFSEDSIIRLADSIRANGILQPLCVAPPDPGGFYKLCAGERRLCAARLLGLRRVPCVIVDPTYAQDAAFSLIGQLHTEGLNMFEVAEAISQLIETHCLTQEKAGELLSYSQSYIANKLRLLKLTPNEREMILAANLTERHARALLSLPTIEQRCAALEKTINLRLNVEATEALCARG